MIASASAIPSYVAVPRPISSNNNKLVSSALRKAWFVSIISTMNVLWPEIKSSAAPIRVKIFVKTGIVALLAGTKHPICARMTQSANCLMYVDLPDIFGPVMRRMCSSGLIEMLFGTYVDCPMTFSTTGWRPSSIQSLRFFIEMVGFTK